MPISTDVESQSVARGVLESVSEQKLVLSIPGTDYQIHLVPILPINEIAGSVGKRIRGTIHANALRMFKAKGGGRFIEPVWGEPRIVAGFVLAVDEPNRRVLVDVAVPIWMTLEDRQLPNMFNVGDLVNCYLKSSTRFGRA